MMRNLNSRCPSTSSEALRTNMTGRQDSRAMLADAAAIVPFMSLAIQALTEVTPPISSCSTCASATLTKAGTCRARACLPRGQLEFGE